MSYRRFSNKECFTSKWTIRCATALLWMGIVLLLLFRVLAWQKKHNPEYKYGKEAQPWRNRSVINVGAESQLPVTICNINPVRGFKVFQLRNGSHLYDVISNTWQSSSNQYNSLGLLSKSVLLRSSHDIKDMLLRCMLSSSKCSTDSFHPVWMDRRLCYQVIMSRTETFLTLALDPEEKHYLIPGQGFTGFKLYFDNIKTTTERSAHTESFYVSSTLHTIIKVSRSTDDNDPGCDSLLYQRCLHQCQGSHSQKCICDHSFNKCHLSYNFISNYQTTQSSFYYRLFMMQRKKHDSQNCEDVLADIIQKRALIRLTDYILFNRIIELSEIVLHISSAKDKITKLSNSIQSQIISDLSRLQLIEDDSGICDLPNLLLQLNSTLETLHNIRQNISERLLECQDQPYISSYTELLIIKTIFSSKSFHLKVPNYSTNINFLTMLNLKFKDKFSSSSSCKNDLVRKIGALYSRLIRDSVSIFLDFSHKHNKFYSLLTSLIDKSASLISSLRKNEINYNKFNLATLSIEVSSMIPTNIAAPQVFTNQAYPMNALSDLVDIICSNIALAVLLIFLVKFISNRCKARRSVSKNIIRRDITTETTDIIQFPNEAAFQQITFTL